MEQQLTAQPLTEQRLTAQPLAQPGRHSTRSSRQINPIWTQNPASFFSISSNQKEQRDWLNCSCCCQSLLTSPLELPGLRLFTIKGFKCRVGKRVFASSAAEFFPNSRRVNVPASGEAAGAAGSGPQASSPVQIQNPSAPSVAISISVLL